jgi:CheY-like chemotaxis protein
MSEQRKRILDVGNCSMDHGAIRRLVEGQLGAEVVQSHTPIDALENLRRGQFDLVLVNRKFDRDDSDGLDLIRAIKREPELAGTPVMLLSNYEEYQQAAVEAGALRGFGKAELASPETAQRLRELLG